MKEMIRTIILLSLLILALMLIWGLNHEVVTNFVNQL